MAAEDIGTIYITKIPGYEDSADIQAALKLYHYGTSNTISTEAQILPNSVVGHIKALDTRIDDIEAQGIGSIVADTMPTGIENGYVWLDSSTSVATSVQYAVSTYSTTAPLNPSIGTLWVDSDSVPLTINVWSGVEWRAIGS